LATTCARVDAVRDCGLWAKTAGTASVRNKNTVRKRLFTMLELLARYLLYNKK
jgi:hypothetical protein